MRYTTTPFRPEHIEPAVALDAQWFGNQGIQAADLHALLAESRDSTIALLRDGTFCGFATFEIIDKHLPNNYAGVFPLSDPLVFVHQFTTDTNYRCTDPSADAALIRAVEQLALQKGVYEVVEALDHQHPYSQHQNREFDAFGFYVAQGYTIDVATQLFWQPSEWLSVACVVFRKKLVAF